MIRAHRTLLPALALLALAACGEAPMPTEGQAGPSPALPAPHEGLLPDMNVARVVGWAEGETPSVPEGLRVAAFATGLANPRELYVLPNGDVLAVESRAPKGKPVSRPKEMVMNWVRSWSAGTGGGGDESNRITLLRDADGDGTPEVRTTFLEGLHSPFGVALVGGDLYVAHADAIVRYPYTEGATEISDPGTVLARIPGGPINHHWTKSLVASPDGSLLYVGIGSNSNAAERGIEAEHNRAAILEVDRANGRWRVFADGLRNPNGLTFHPATGELWTVVNERDELGPDLVPDYLTHVEDGGFYGWPYSYFGQNVDPRVRPQRPDLVERAIAPDYALGAHVAALGLAFAAGDRNLGDRFRDGAFVGQHGSWNRDHPSGYRVVFIPFANGRPNGPPVDVVTGFLAGDGAARGRPVGVTFDATGALLVADDAGNAVWRVSAAN